MQLYKMRPEAQTQGRKATPSSGPLQPPLKPRSSQMVPAQVAINEITVLLSTSVLKRRVLFPRGALNLSYFIRKSVFERIKENNL